MQLIKSSCWQHWLSLLPLQVLSSVVCVIGLYCSFSSVHFIWAVGISFHKRIDHSPSTPKRKSDNYFYFCLVNQLIDFGVLHSLCFKLLFNDSYINLGTCVTSLLCMLELLKHHLRKKESHVTVLLILKLLFSAVVGISRLLGGWGNIGLDRSPIQYMAMSHHTTSLCINLGLLLSI